MDPVPPTPPHLHPTPTDIAGSGFAWAIQDPVSTNRKETEKEEDWDCSSVGESLPHYHDPQHCRRGMGVYLREKQTN